MESIRLSNTCVAERLEVTIVRNKQCNYNSRAAARGKVRLVENRLKSAARQIKVMVGESNLFELHIVTVGIYTFIVRAIRVLGNRIETEYGGGGGICMSYCHIL